MKTNLIKAFINLVSSNQSRLSQDLTSPNRITLQWKALEEFIKDIFCDTVNLTNINEKLKIQNQKLSWQWSLNNPPDLILRDGDAIEVKKLGSETSISLNSSHPKDKIYSNDSRILPACRNCENWTVKDMIYAIGVVKEDSISNLWLIYGDCFAAERDIYDRTFNSITNAFTTNSQLKFSPTNELWRVNNVDPLGITYFRIRGMWWIEHPSKVFDYLPIAKEGDFVVNVLMLKSKYLSFPIEDRNTLEALSSRDTKILEVEIKSPNNPVRLLEAVLITFTR